MDLCDQALAARLSGDESKAERLFRKAFDQERLAAAEVESEPTRSVLHRSAASLALEFGEHRGAEKLIAAALAGEPPREIAEELRDLLEKVNFQRHLELRGLQLADNELQLSLSGKAVSFGMVQSDQFLERVRSMERMLFRTVERKCEMPFRETGRAVKDVSKNFELYLSAPRAASFAVTLRVGLPDRQMWLPDWDQEILDQPNVVIDNLLDCLEAFNVGDPKRLEELIPDKSYRRNFAALADQMAPDGEEVKVVGLTVSRNGQERRVALTHDRERKPERREQTPESSRKELEGTLRRADSLKKDRDQITVVDAEGQFLVLRVQSGMMADIVKPLWEERVRITATRGKKEFVLETIKKAAGPAANGSAVIP
jgi:hypothetical protein